MRRAAVPIARADWWPGDEQGGNEMRETRQGVKLPVKRTTGDTLEQRMTENAYRHVLPARYLRKDAESNVVESQEELFRRVADNLAQPEARYGGNVGEMADTFYRLMTQLEFMPNSPTLMNAGAELQQLAACFVMSPKDALDSIFDTVKRAATVFQSGGGVGYAFSQLRPQGDRVKSTGGIASGPVSFMLVFDRMCETLKQGGKRRGAQMGILRVDHPDIGRFVVAKRREGVLANFNISVAVTDAFCLAVRDDADYQLLNPRTGQPFRVVEQTAQFYSTEFEDAAFGAVSENFWRDHAPQIEQIEVFRGRTDLQVGEEMRLPAAFIWRLLVDGGWRNGEPGLFMIDRANRDHSFDVERHPDHRVEATNPCGEQPLEDFEACTLGHINLSLMAADEAPVWSRFRAEHDGSLSSVVASFLERAIDWDHLEEVTSLGTRFLDNAVTMSVFPLAEITQKEKGLRNIGLGIMGFAELLLQLDVVYGSEESIEIARQVMAAINHQSKMTSHELALERGTFAGWEASKYADPMAHPEWFRQHTGLDPAEWRDGFALRNHHTTTVAPTGTTSMIANASGGCEPLYDIAYFRNAGADIQGQTMLVEFNDYFLRVLEANGIDAVSIRDQARRQMRNNEYNGPHSLPIPAEIADLFITAGKIPPEDHVRIQAALQEHVDSAVSKTVNFANEATRADVETAYGLAVDLGCKGLTVYRAGSRREQVLQIRARSESEEKEEILAAIKRQYGSLDAFLSEVFRGSISPRVTCPECEGDLNRSEGTVFCPQCGYTPH
jgi:adenosylcobalamin-dependent ribonucleoside-diphosphate reductase